MLVVSELHHLCCPIPNFVLSKSKFRCSASRQAHSFARNNIPMSFVMHYQHYLSVAICVYQLALAAIMGDENAAKRARILGLRDRLPFLSVAALAKVSEIAQTEPIPEITEKTIRMARNQECETATPYGKVHETIRVPGKLAGHSFDVEVQHPFAFLYYVISMSACLSNLILRLIDTVGCSPMNPWHLIFYNDEITPGNQLSYANLRKCQCVYWSLLEFGNYLSDEEAWFCALLLRSTVAAKAVCGISTIVGLLVRLFFSEVSHNFSTSGITLKLFNGRTVQVWIRYAITLADEAALKYIYESKGSAGLKPCSLCINVYDAKNERGIVEGGRCVLHTCADAGKLVFLTAVLFEAIVARLLAAAATSAEALKEAETNLGWNLRQGCAMSDPYLRRTMNPCTTLVYDWCHGIFVNGVFNHHIGDLMAFLASACGITYSTLHAYACVWVWPRRLKKVTGVAALTGARAKANKSHGELRCSASEGMSLLPVLAHYFRRGIAESTDATVRLHGTCVLLLYTIVLLIERSGRQEIAPGDLLTAVEKFLSTYKELYGDRNMTIKFHWLLHFPYYLERFHFIPSCFTLERKHKTPKRYINNVHNTSASYDANMLREMTVHHIHELRDMEHFTPVGGLVNAHEPKRSMLKDLAALLGDAHCRTAVGCRINPHEIAYWGDVVLYRRNNRGRIGAGEVRLFVLVEEAPGQEHLLAILSEWELLLAQPTFSRWRLRRPERCCAICCGSLFAAVIYTVDADTATVLHPSRI